MTLILCEDGDAAAHWVAAQFARRGAPATLLTSGELGGASRWDHRVEAGRASIAITLADGRMFSSDAPMPILNRLGTIPLRPLRAIAGADYGYAVQELTAFYLSWLHAWPATVINRPAPQGLGGRYRHISDWLQQGAEAGLETIAWTQGSADPPDLGWQPQRPADATAFVVAGRPVLPPQLPGALAEPVRRLGARAGTALIGVDFVGDPARGWTMAGASPFPNLPIGGPPLIDALIEALAA